MADADGREVTIVAPFDDTVTAVVMEESLPVWLAQDWRMGSALAEALPVEEPVEVKAPAATSKPDVKPDLPK